MLNALLQLTIFTAKAIILVMLILILLIGITAILSRGKDKLFGKVRVKNLNEKFSETFEEISQQILPKKKFKEYIKTEKEKQKAKKETELTAPLPTVFVVNFHGDIKASAVSGLSEIVTAILGVAKPNDEVVVRLESGGGMVHSYGLAAAQLQRLREKNIFLTICIDKVAASGGYMMASIANKILAAPFAIVGSIGVIVQIPNFHRLLKEKHIDFEQLTAGNFKRTLTMFGHNTEEGREKLREEIEEIHLLFKNLIHENRPQLDIEKVATGEHWLAKQAIEFKLVDELKTSDDYLLEQSKRANLYEITYVARKTLGEKLFAAAHFVRNAFVASPY